MADVWRFFEEPQLGAKVTAYNGAGGSIEPKIDENGIINFPPEMLWMDIATEEQYQERQQFLATQFQLTVAYEEGRKVVVAQRTLRDHKIGDRWYLSAATTGLGGLVEKTFSPCSVEHIFRRGWDLDRYGPVAVWTETAKAEGSSNRADCWILHEDGQLDMFQILLLTLNDGKTFRCVGTYHWRGWIFRREKPGYTIVSRDEKIRKAAEQVKYYLDGYAFLPDFGYQDFEGRCEILYHLPKYLAEAELRPWEMDEESLHPEPDYIPQRKLRFNEAFVKFWTPGLGQDSMGYAVPGTPIPIYQDGKRSIWTEGRIFGREVREEPDEQGLKPFNSGDIIRFGGWHESHDRRNPRLLNVSVAERWSPEKKKV